MMNIFSKIISSVIAALFVFTSAFADEMVVDTKEKFLKLVSGKTVESPQGNDLFFNDNGTWGNDYVDGEWSFNDKGEYCRDLYKGTRTLMKKKCGMLISDGKKFWSKKSKVKLKKRQWIVK